MRKKLYDLMAQRAAAIDAAEAAIDAGDEAAYNERMTSVENMDREIDKMQRVINERERHAQMAPQSEAEARDVVEGRVAELRAGHEVQIPVNEILRSVRNTDGDGTLYSGTIAQPTGAGANVNDNIGACSLLDLVRVEDMTGLSGWEEPYAISDPTPAKGAPASTAGSSRTASDPTFGISVIKPYEVSTTSFVDRNIALLSPANYYAKVQQMALRALKNEICKLILLGDAESTHVMYGMINGTNKAGSSIVDTVEATVASSAGKVDTDLLDNLYFTYGDGLTVGGNGMVFLNKKDLKALGKLRGTNEKGRLYAINPMQGDACRGTISDGGMIIPYLVNGALTADRRQVSAGFHRV